ncbi:MAG: SRPBCC family protein [Hyphomonadaceae bacterium]|nr:SRPBCC family protein [Hyphomonadaceae bacterium]
MKFALIAALVLGGAVPASADIIASAPDHYTLQHEAISELSPEEAWNRLVDPRRWWHPDHTYSGRAEALSLDLQAGGLWREDWDGGSVAHGEVMQVQTGKMLVLDAPFGPLQGMGVNVVWTIRLEAEEEGTKITFLEVANGSAASGLDAIAPAVDGVKSVAIQRLAGQIEVPVEN